MSNNSNNIYNILSKLEALKPTAQEKHDATVKAIYESVEAQGSVLEGVDAVQSKLAQQFAEAKKAKPDFLDIDGDKNKKETMKQAAADKIEEGQMKQMMHKDAERMTREQFCDRYGDDEGYFWDSINKDLQESTCNECGMNEGECEHTMEGANTFTPDDIQAAIDYKNTIGHIYTIANGKIRFNLMNMDRSALNKILSRPLATQQDWDMLKKQMKQALASQATNEGMSRAAKGYEKYGKKGMQALAKAGRDGAGEKELDTIRDKHDQYNEAEECCCKDLGQKECPVHCNDEPRRSVKEAEITRTDGKTVHRKTEFPGYPMDDTDDLEGLRGPGAGKRGRPRKHAAKAPTGLGRGRPVKAKAPTFSKQADPFGRTTGVVPAGEKGQVHSVAERMNLLSARLIEGINFSNMMKETDQHIDELMNELQNDIKEYKATGHCSEKLKDFMQVHAHSKKQMADEASAIPPTTPAIPQGIPGNVPVPGKMDRLSGGRDYYEEEVTMEDELNELAKLAGLSEVSRGEYIKQQDTAAEKSGKDKFQAFGQEFDTDEITEEPNEGNTFTAGLKDDDVKIGDKIPGTNAIKKVDIDESTSFDGNESSDFNISTNMSSDGDKNVTVTATGEHAATLLQMLRIAGLGSGQTAQDLEAGQNSTEQPSAEVVVIDNPESMMGEEGIEVDHPAQDPANAPHEKYGTIKNITTQGDDMNREKTQDPATANKAANPMTNAQSVLKSVAQLESKLAKEYESIKKVSK